MLFVWPRWPHAGLNLNKPKWHKIAGWNKVEVDMNRLRNEYLDLKRPVTEIANDYCVTVTTIYSRLKKLGITRTNSESHIGKPAWNNKGGSIDQMGYRLVHVNGKQVREHRVIAELMLGRKLRPGEVVHHKNGVRSDNSPGNLEVHESHSVHMKQHMSPEEARSRGAKGLKTILKNRRIKAHIKALGHEA